MLTRRTRAKVAHRIAALTAAIVTATVVLGFANDAHAQNYWTEESEDGRFSFWDIGTNWSSDSAPSGSGSGALFDRGRGLYYQTPGKVRVALRENVSIGYLGFNDGRKPSSAVVPALPLDLDAELDGHNRTLSVGNIEVIADARTTLGLHGDTRVKLSRLTINNSGAIDVLAGHPGNVARLELRDSTVNSDMGFSVSPHAILEIYGTSYTTGDASHFGLVGEGASFLTGSSTLNSRIVNNGIWNVYDSTRLRGRLDGLGEVKLNSNSRLFLEYSGSDGISNSISGNGALVVDAGHVVLDGNNSFTGGLYIEDGATVEVSRPGHTGGLANTIHFNGGDFIIDGSEGQYQYYTDKWKFNSDTNFTVAGSTEIHGSFSGSGNIQKLGTGQMYLRGDNSSYAGMITVESGQLTAGANDSLGDSTRVVVEQAGSFRLEGDENWGSISGAGFIDLGAHSATLIENQSATVAGRVRGSGVLHMTGTGKIRFDTHSNLSDFTGDMSVHSGAIELDGFSISRFDGGMITSGEGVAVFNTRNTDLTYSGALQNAGRVLKTGTGVLELSQNNFGSFPGVVEVRQGTLRASHVPGDTLQLTGGKFESTGSYFVDRIDTASIGGTLDTGSGNATVREALTGAGNLLKHGNGNLELTFGNSDHSGFTGELNIQEGMLRLRTSLNNGRVHLGSQGALESTSNDMAVSLGGLSGSGAVHVGEASTARSIRVGGLNQDSTFSGSLEGPGSLVKTGSGTLSFTGHNAGSTIEVRQGTLGITDQGLGAGIQLSDGTTLRLLESVSNPYLVSGQGTIDLGNNGTTMNLSGTGKHIMRHTLVGNGGLNVTSGAHTLTSINSFTGGINLAGGSLIVSRGANTGGLANTINFDGGELGITNSGEFHTSLWRVHSDSSLSVASDALAKFAGTLDGSGHLRKLGTGRLELEGNFFPFNGSFSVEEGTLAIAGSTSRLRSDLSITESANVVFSPNFRSTYSGAIQGEGSVFKNGSGELVFQGDSSGLSGAFLVNNGTLSGSGTFGNLEIGAATFSPGESPAIVEIENFNLRSTGLLDVELGGLLAGLEYDQLRIAGDATIAGMLNVSLIDGFTLGFNQEFLIADIGGTLTGEFQGLSEGALVGAFNDQDLFITYRAGSGNSIGLFTAVPEPSCSGLCLMLGIAACMRRRRA